MKLEYWLNRNLKKSKNSAHYCTYGFVLQIVYLYNGVLNNYVYLTIDMYQQLCTYDFKPQKVLTWYQFVLQSGN